MQQNYFAVREKRIVTEADPQGHIIENIIAVFQNEDDAITFKKAVPKNTVKLYSKNELIQKYRKKDE